METRIAWPPFTKNLKITLGVLAGLFLLQVSPAVNAFVQQYLLISRSAVVEDYQLWTFLTYAFFHANFTHILFNGLVLWMFGGELDRNWTNRSFWTVSLGSALGGGVFIFLSQLLIGHNVPTLGYSGAVMGIVAAFAWYNWDRKINFFFFPMTGKTMLLVMLGLDIFMVVGSGEPISISGHVGGMLTGLLLVSGWWKPTKLKAWWRRRKMKQNFKEAQRDVDRKRNGKWIN